MRYAVCVVGHVTRDLSQSAEGSTERIGGTAYYTAIALSRPGMKVAVVTKLHQRDRSKAARMMSTNCCDDGRPQPQAIVDIVARYMS